MKAYEIIVIIVCIIIVVSVIIKSVIDIKHGKTCNGNCNSCGAYCVKNKDKEKNKMAKYLKCVSCGAIVKVITPCTCPNCGIKCCGKEMVEVDCNEKGTGEILTCSSCGAKVEVVKPCNCPNCGIQCCGKEMK